ncbi:MAG: hypothetical protein ISR96_06845 [Nitrospira sp.]|nr:hypothetical protein [bacterium]MBL7049211.1 hypothetical protein [Nitrospira sp.]
MRYVLMFFIVSSFYMSSPVYAQEAAAEAEVVAEEEVKPKKPKPPLYVVIEFENGGNIFGKAIFTGGTRPPAETLTITSEKEFCGDTLPAKKFSINAANEIKNAVVFLADIKEGKAVPEQDVIIDNVGCAFEPRIHVGFSAHKNKAVNTNSDPVFHNVHAYIRGRTVYNLGIPETGFQAKRKLRPGLMSIKCNAHPWMLAYSYNFPHPYASLTDDSGSFSLTNIPAGEYELKAWHEGFGEISLGKVTIAGGDTVEKNAEFSEVSVKKNTKKEHMK